MHLELGHDRQGQTRVGSSLCLVGLGWVCSPQLTYNLPSSWGSCLAPELHAQGWAGTHSSSLLAVGWGWESGAWKRHRRSEPSGEQLVRLLAGRGWQGKAAGSLQVLLGAPCPAAEGRWAGSWPGLLSLLRRGGRARGGTLRTLRSWGPSCPRPGSLCGPALCQSVGGCLGG